jgi:excinuclease UvrABC nuclease subunit
MTTSTAVPTVTFSRSLGQYHLSAYALGTPFNDVPAVYVITRREPDLRHHPIYVGQTQNLRQRFANHQKWPCMMRNGANYVCVVVITDEANRLAIENDLIAAYHPPCN